MYVTCYASKNTSREDVSDYIKLGQHMIHKLEREEELMREEIEKTRAMHKKFWKMKKITHQNSQSVKKGFEL